MLEERTKERSEEEEEEEVGKGRRGGDKRRGQGNRRGNLGRPFDWCFVWRCPRQSFLFVF